MQVGNDFAEWQIFSSYDKYNSRSDFSFIRILNGKVEDKLFPTHWANVTTRKAPYLNLKPYSSIADQINKFYSLVMSIAPDFSLPPMIDEENLLLTSGMISQAWELSKNMFGNYPIPYSSVKYWLKAYPDYPSVPRFPANYPNSLKDLRYDVQMESKILLARLAGFPSMPSDWGTFVPKKDFWQCSKSGYGPDWGLNWYESKAIDVDYFEGDEADLAKVMDDWSGTVTPPPIPPVPPSENIVPIKEVQTVANLNVRSIDNVSGNDIGTLRSGTIVPVVKESGKWYRIDGWIHGDYTKDV